MNTDGRMKSGVEDLPYWNDYLTLVLRPRVEAALRACEQTLQEAVWGHLLDAMMADQQQHSHLPPQALRSLLEHKLGLKLDIALGATFNPETAAPATNGTAPPPTNSSAAANLLPVEQVDGTIRRRSSINPLASAVFGGRKPSI